MPLVDYESSDDGSGSDYEESIKETQEKGNQEKPAKLSSVDINGKHEKTDENVTLFSALPKPRTNSFFADDNKLSKLLLHKQSTLGKKTEGESIKISVPSVSEFDDANDQPLAKKLKPSVKGVGLFSILPPPKNESVKQSNRTLVPQVVAKNQQSINAGSNVSFKNKKATVTNEGQANEDDDDDEGAAVGCSFFGNSLSEPRVNKTSDENIAKINDHLCDAPQFDVASNTRLHTGPNAVGNSLGWGTIEQTSSHSNDHDAMENNYYYPLSTSQAPETIPFDNNPLELDEKALQILCGGKKKRQQMPMNIIDLSGEEIMPDSKEWLLKQFTEEKKVRSHSHRKSDGPSSQSRRKHQITYLAFQAKEQELELQNQWANNRMSRKQTQSKYGF